MDISIDDVLAKLDQLAGRNIRLELALERMAARVAELEAQLARGRKKPKP